MSTQSNTTHSFVSNYHDRDPISLEPIARLSTRSLFFVKDMNGKMNGYDALAWLPWLVDGNRVDPCTKRRLSAQEIWECFIICHNLDPENDAVKKCMHTSVKLKNSTTVVPTSPLLNIRIRSFGEIARSSTGKEVELVYDLIDSRDYTAYLENKKAIVELPLHMNLSIGF